MYLVPEQPSDLQKSIRVARKYVVQQARQADHMMRQTVDHVIMLEGKIEQTIKQVRPRDERFLPGGIYVGVSTLFGSIVARNRSLPIRLLAPPTLFVVSARIFLPKLSRNVGDYLYDQEVRVPPLREAHDQVRAGIVSGLWKAGDAVDTTTQAISSRIDKF